MLTKKKGKISTNKDQENFLPKHRSPRVTLKITHKKIKTGLSLLSKNPMKIKF